eukprot:CAMPEP_0114157894 /NCGR_PEP_ID=MMETSP0043_2-20121206/26881_1 /TAXON_ID=464988 /ORGANISM="Hemiselmis andersenii, Strain CCMP644" /LENGTH=139 /DNA_ID=CAMNT_0001253525 /DNA_START=175 /DNA_END=592 /DNA_ORIENTATION=+
MRGRAIATPVRLTPVSALIVTAPPMVSMALTMTLVSRQKQMKQMCAGFPHRDSTISQMVCAPGAVRPGSPPTSTADEDARGEARAHEAVGGREVVRGDLLALARVEADRAVHEHRGDDSKQAAKPKHNGPGLAIVQHVR